MPNVIFLQRVSKHAVSAYKRMEISTCVCVELAEYFLVRYYLEVSICDAYWLRRCHFQGEIDEDKEMQPIALAVSIEVRSRSCSTQSLPENGYLMFATTVPVLSTS